MIDMISRDDAIAYIRDHFCNRCDTYNDVKCVFCDTGDAISALKDVPAVDAVEVVRCKDCQFFMEYRKRTETADGDCRAKMFDDADRLLCLPVKYSDFCSQGRKRK